MSDEYRYAPYPTPDNLDSFNDWFSRYRGLYPDLFSTVLSKERVKTVLDGASGLGASTLAIAETLPRAHITAVGYDKPRDDVRKAIGRRLTFRQEDLMRFLQSNRKPFDMVNIAQAGYISGLYTTDEYDILTRNVNSGGYLVTVDDTTLDPTQMRRNFTQIKVPGYDVVQVWQK